MLASGRVVQVNVSQGGVPKLPVERAWVGRLGLEGDAHRERTVHGGPQRAVCLFSIEAIERLQSEGHPLEPGSVGENLTTSGVEWSLLPVGARARIGDELEIELASSTTPCATQKPNFSDGRFSRISIDLHPSDSRMYARVVREGEVRPGDAIVVLPPDDDSTAAAQLLLNKFDAGEKEASLRLWRAARAAGLDVRVLDDGDICAGASPSFPGPAFNHAQGLRLMPQLLPEVLAHFASVGSVASIPWEAPTPDAEPELSMSVHACPPAEVRPAPTPSGVVVRRVGRAEQPAWIELFSASMTREEQAAWRALLPHLLDTRGVHAVLALVDGRPAGTGLLHVKREAGLLRGGFVAEPYRGRGIQRALIAARAELAGELECRLLASLAEAGSASATNLERMGLVVIATQPVFRYVASAGRA